MGIPINDQEFAGRGLAVQPAGILRGQRLILDGQEVRGKRGIYRVRNNSGNEVVVKLKGNLVDPIPKVTLAQREIELARPLLWYEYLWIGLPILLVFAGGALGAILGVLATRFNATVLRSEGSGLLKYGKSGLVSIAAVLVFLAIATLIQALIRGR